MEQAWYWRMTFLSCTSRMWIPHRLQMFLQWMGCEFSGTCGLFSMLMLLKNSVGFWSCGHAVLKKSCGSVWGQSHSLSQEEWRAPGMFRMEPSILLLLLLLNFTHWLIFSFLSFFFVFFCRLRSSCTLGKCSMIELHSQPSSKFLS